MRDRQLERRIRRINGEAEMPRALAAMAALVALAAAFAFRDSPADLTALLLITVVAAATWLRQYHRARRVHGEIVSDLAVGAFLGGSVVGVLLDAPASLQAWLRAPATEGAPAAVVVLMLAMLEDLLRWLLGHLRRG